jgi:hypothetical protein
LPAQNRKPFRTWEGFVADRLDVDAHHDQERTAVSNSGPRSGRGPAGLGLPVERVNQSSDCGNETCLALLGWRFGVGLAHSRIRTNLKTPCASRRVSMRCPASLKSPIRFGGRRPQQPSRINSPVVIPSAPRSLRRCKSLCASSACSPRGPSGRYGFACSTCSTVVASSLIRQPTVQHRAAHVPPN